MMMIALCSFPNLNIGFFLLSYSNPYVVIVSQKTVLVCVMSKYWS